MTDLIVDKTDLGAVRLVPSPLAEAQPGPGQVLLEVERFALTSNNLSYAGAGDFLGYWNFFPAAEEGWGVVPSWGFATVLASQHSEIAVGDQLFGYVPMGRRLMIEPASVNDMWCDDRFAHRADLHPWYNRYYRVGADPSTVASVRDLAPVLWALHMTGWMLADQFGQSDHFGADHVLVASASSKTAQAFARSMQQLGSGPNRIGLTSAANAGFVEALGCYDDVRTYDSMSLDDLAGTAALVDMSGNAAVVSEVHHTFGDRLVESVRIGSTHRSARGDTDGLPGAARRFFFIPDVAEARAADIGHEAFHREFAAAWVDHAEWAVPHTSIETRTGPEAIRDAYLAAHAGAHDPAVGLMLAY